MPTKHKGSPSEIAALNAFIKFQRAHINLGTLLASHVAGKSLTPGQFGVLETLWHLGPLRQHELGGKLLSSKPNISAVITNLERNGLVGRERDAQDGRSVLVRLTPKGRRLIEKAFPEFLAFLIQAFSVMLTEELETLGALTKKLGLSLAKFRAKS